MLLVNADTIARSILTELRALFPEYTCRTTAFSGIDAIVPGILFIQQNTTAYSDCKLALAFHVEHISAHHTGTTWRSIPTHRFVYADPQSITDLYEHIRWVLNLRPMSRELSPMQLRDKCAFT